MSKWLRHCADYPVFDRITPQDDVVDIGCGAGDACVAAGMLGASVVALDIDPSLVPHLEGRMRGVPARSFRAIASDCNPIPLPDGSASFVICTEVMEHVDDPAQFASELNRIGRPGATYMISVPDPASETLMKRVAHPTYFEKPNHRRIYAHDAFDELLRAAGFDPIDRPRSPNNFYWAMWCLLRWADSPDGNPLPGAIPPVLDHWNQVWTTLGSSPGGEEAIALLDRLFPRTQLVVARKSARVVDRSELEARWDHLVRRDENLSNPSGRSVEDERLMARSSRDVSALPVVPGPHLPKSGWRRFVKDGQVKLGRIDLSWAIRRSTPKPSRMGAMDSRTSRR